jgi:hypothetical protein
LLLVLRATIVDRCTAGPFPISTLPGLLTEKIVDDAGLAMEEIKIGVVG